MTRMTVCIALTIFIKEILSTDDAAYSTDSCMAAQQPWVSALQALPDVSGCTGPITETQNRIL